MRLSFFLVLSLSLTAVLAPACSTHPACETDADCGSGSACFYPIGDCSAKGECFLNSEQGTCDFITGYCGCDGSSVHGGACGEPAGYASGPTLGNSLCAN